MRMLMDTIEHTELGNALRLNNPENNPYIRIDEFGVMHLRLQRFGSNNLPEAMSLEMSAGEIIAMAGDFFTQANWTMDLNLPPCDDFKSAYHLGHKLISKPVSPKEEAALITAYNNLASPEVSRRDINRIYKITKSTFHPFSSTLNAYMKQLMFYLRVKDYGEMLIRNQTHFTPWAIRVYILGHSIAMRYAHLSYELQQLAANPNYLSNNPDLTSVKNSFVNRIPASSELVDLAHRYHAQALSMELFTFHYYSDHFATGHMSMMGDLRLVLQERFGMLGSVLVNNLHDEINRIGVYTSKPYAPNPNINEAPNRAQGDGEFNSCLNQFNRRDCLLGMTASLNDITNVLNGSAIPAQKNYSGLKYLPDVDYSSRQHAPLFILSGDKVYYRNSLSKINVLAPSTYEILRANPKDKGYSELTNKWAAFRLVTKLRLFPYFYRGKIKPISQELLAEIIKDEKTKNPQRPPILESPCDPKPEGTVFDWRKTENNDWKIVNGLNQYGLLKLQPNHLNIEKWSSTQQDVTSRESLLGQRPT